MKLLSPATSNGLFSIYEVSTEESRCQSIVSAVDRRWPVRPECARWFWLWSRMVVIELFQAFTDNQSSLSKRCVWRLKQWELHQDLLYTTHWLMHTELWADKAALAYQQDSVQNFYVKNMQYALLRRKCLNCIPNMLIHFPKQMWNVMTPVFSH